MRITVADHPLVTDRLTRMRARETDRAGFRRCLTELSGFLIYEATRGHAVTPIEIDTPMGPSVGARIADVPILVPVMRAGLGMLSAALDVLPDARTGFAGMKRDEETLLPHAYVNTVPDQLNGRDVFVLDPMLATGGSAIQTCAELRRSRAGRITLVCVLAAPEGVEALREAGVADVLVTGAIDERLNDMGFIVPGLGDAGDRQFGLN
ncbi:MAG: uracil phosphoribosyltransferase [Actinobacteria bacterium]|nr:uracil phosphoribosyltransferase [Actinomycetota bacterium]